MAVNPVFADLMHAMCAAAGPTRTIEPGEIARAFAEISAQSNEAWPHYLQNVRDIAVRLARDGKLIIYCRGVPADPETFRGSYRLGSPNLG